MDLCSMMTICGEIQRQRCSFRKIIIKHIYGVLQPEGFLKLFSFLTVMIISSLQYKM